MRQSIDPRAIKINKKGQKKTVCAIIVSYNPDVLLVRSIEAILDQVDGVIIVDNGSDYANWETVYSSHGAIFLFQSPKIKIIWNADNFGVGFAFNIGIKKAKTEGFDFVILMDQDSVVSDNVFPSTVDEYARLQSSINIGVLSLENREYHYLQTTNPLTRISMSLKKIKTAEKYNSHIRQVWSTIFSGMLMDISVFEKVGYLKEDYFIGAEDTEFCFRIRRNGMNVAQYHTSGAFILHRIGDQEVSNTQEQNLLQSWVFPHKPWRHYYIVRNALHTSRLYFSTFPRESILLLLSIPIFLSFEIFAYGPRIIKIKFAIRGFIDFLNCKMGKVVCPS